MLTGDTVPDGWTDKLVVSCIVDIDNNNDDKNNTLNLKIWKLKKKILIFCRKFNVENSTIKSVLDCDFFFKMSIISWDIYSNFDA